MYCEARIYVCMCMQYSDVFLNPKFNGNVYETSDRFRVETKKTFGEKLCSGCTMFF